MSELSNVKAGDTVILWRTYLYKYGDLVTVARVTPTQIIVPYHGTDHKFQRYGGRGIGSTKYVYRIEAATDENLRAFQAWKQEYDARRKAERGEE